MDFIFNFHISQKENWRKFCAKTKAPTLKYGETAPNKKLRIFYNPINWQCKCFV